MWEAAAARGAAAAGAFVNGEIGPAVRGGARGWRGGGGWATAAAGVEEGAVPPQTLRQAYTSIFVGVGGPLAGAGGA
jgi:hypothetical protein